MATASPLLGPPSLRDASATASVGAAATNIPQESTLVGPTADADNAYNFVDEKPIRGFTENMAATFLTTGNPCLDFFFKVVPNTPPESLIGLLEIAWAFNPLMTLKLICNLRGVRGTGKSDKEGFYTAALWLHHVHPKTLVGNVKAISEFGYFKDFLEILFRILEGPTIREIQKVERPIWSRNKRSRHLRRYKRSRRHYHEIENETEYQIDYGIIDNETEYQIDYGNMGPYPGAYKGPRTRVRTRLRTKINNWETTMRRTRINKGDYEAYHDQQLGEYEAHDDYGYQWSGYSALRTQRLPYFCRHVPITKRTLDLWVAEILRKTPEDIKREREKEEARALQKEKEKARALRALRKEKERNKAINALEMYNGDEDYRLLHDSVAGFFHELLMADLEKLKSGKLNKISLAAKWSPTIDSSYDKATLICESIARKTFPREKYPEYEGLEDRHYVYRVRDRLRKEVLVPLHKALELPEVYMSANKWNALPYNRVPSVAMKKYHQLFFAHDKKRFAEYLKDVKSGKAKIAAGALLPHEIIGSVEKEEEREVAELQWKRLVDDMIQKGKLSNCIAVCDVSGSMQGEPMEVSVALGILVSELSEEPWKGKLITFSEHPVIQTVQGESLLEKTEFVRNMDWGGSTNFQGVFDRILEVAVEEKLKDEQLVKRVFVFSDMEFNQASTSSYRTHYRTMRRRYLTNATNPCETDSSCETDPWETDYQAIQRKYSQHGYKSVPEIVFWNLRDSRSIPVAGKQSGVALVSGFSKNLLTIFLDGGGIVNPVEAMELAVAGEEYQKLTVLD